MTFYEWFFGTVDNPYKAGQWRPLHIFTMLACVMLSIGFYQLVKRVQKKALARQTIIMSLVSLIVVFEIAMRIVYFVRLYHLKTPDMAGLNTFWIIMPKPWCDVACWSLIASVFVNKKFFYNYAAISSLICTSIFFAYPGVGFNNEIMLFSNIYSIVTHALLVVTAVTLITFGYTDFRFKDIWKIALCFAATVVYALLEIYVFKLVTDPMYFMPGGDIQANILNISYWHLIHKLRLC